jgi:tetratricopeptide (TPR) repeat protein
VRAWRRFALLLLAVAVLAAAAVAGARLVGARRAQLSFRERIREFDDLAGRGYRAKAEASLRAAAASAASEQDWLRLLKRALPIAASTGNFAELAKLARRAADRIPGSRPLARLYLYARLRAGQSGATEPFRGLSTDPDGQCLVAEAWASAPRETPPPAGLSPQLEELLAAARRPEPESLRVLAARWQEEALLRDAGLGWMAAGDLARAAAAFRELPDGPVARELRLAAAYDSGSWEEALGYLGEETQPPLERVLVRADLLALLGKDREAAGLYQQAIARDARFFWSPYVNLGGILARRGENEAAAELYRRAYELFPESEAAAAALLASLVRSGEPEAAYRVLERALERFPESLPLRWLLLELGRKESRPERYLAGLRRLYTENPRNALLCQTLVAHLLGLADPAGAWAVLEEYEGTGEEAWLLEARGLAKALEGDPAAGAGWLRRGVAASGDGRARCNLAVLLAASGETEAAVREFMQASDELAGRPRLASQARARLAEVLLAGGNRAAARRESSFALELDPGNGRALLLLRTLEAE